MVTGSADLHNYHEIPEQFELLKKQRKGNLLLSDYSFYKLHYAVEIMVRERSTSWPKFSFY